VYSVLIRGVYIGVQRFLCISIYKFGLNFIEWVHFFPFVQSKKLDVERMFIIGQEVECFLAIPQIKLMLGEYIKIMLCIQCVKGHLKSYCFLYSKAIGFVMGLK
jgi:hypothetical protein